MVQVKTAGPEIRNVTWWGFDVETVLDAVEGIVQIKVRLREMPSFHVHATRIELIRERDALWAHVRASLVAEAGRDDRVVRLDMAGVLQNVHDVHCSGAEQMVQDGRYLQCTLRRDLESWHGATVSYRMPLGDYIDGILHMPPIFVPECFPRIVMQEQERPLANVQLILDELVDGVLTVPTLGGEPGAAPSWLACAILPSPLRALGASGILATRSAQADEDEGIRVRGMWDQLQQITGLCPCPKIVVVDPTEVRACFNDFGPVILDWRGRDGGNEVHSYRYSRELAFSLAGIFVGVGTRVFGANASDLVAGIRGALQFQVLGEFRRELAAAEEDLRKKATISRWSSLVGRARRSETYMYQVMQGLHNHWSTAVGKAHMRRFFRGIWGHELSKGRVLNELRDALPDDLFRQLHARW